LNLLNFLFHLGAPVGFRIAFAVCKKGDRRPSILPQVPLSEKARLKLLRGQ
jgi:hypothetical protein